MARKITLSNGDWFVLKDSRFIHIYITIDDVTTEMGGFQNGEAVTWEKQEDDVVADDDFKGIPVALINHSKRGNFTLNLNDGSMSNALIYSAYNRQMTYSEDELATFGLKVQNDNNGEIVQSPTCLLQKMTGGSVSNAIAARTWTVLGFEYSDTFDLSILE